MIQLPRRSVTRFFIPLIDVLTLLFCIFLLMPMVKPSEEATGKAEAAERVRDLERQLEALRRAGAELTPEERQKLEQLQKERVKLLEQRLRVRVLEIDPGTGKLSYNDPERIVIRNEADARELLERDGRDRTDGRELYYLILYPRDRNSPYPLRRQREEYDRWFNNVAHGWDVPGTGPARGGD
jgi:hypothetical protein